MSGALAIFAKTPSLSPVKTRLADGIGKPLAEDFYSLSVDAVTEIVRVAAQQSNDDFVPYWALAEQEALDYPQWESFKTVWTGEGDFGARLNTIYATLQEQHDYVILIGTDSPQLEPELLVSAIENIKEHPKSCVIGPCPDGGFYLFVAKVPIAAKVWTKVLYSQSNTLEALSTNLVAQGIAIELLPVQGDVDAVNDFKPLIRSLEENKNLLPAQQKLYTWLQSQ
jgi:hypothetical protein